MRQQWDVFVSHASEDKLSFVEPLTIALANVGLTVWYDKTALTLGDSLSRGIDEGLANCSFGIVVVSPAFLAKSWPAYELSGLVSREVGGKKTILPIWHNVTRDMILKVSPTLADKLAVRTEDSTPADIAMQILQVVRPDIYDRTPRAELISRMDGSAIQRLENELEAVLEELREFQCPDCGAPLVESMEVPVSDRDSDSLKSFECSRRQIGGEVLEFCPSSPQYPRFEDIQIQTFHDGEIWHAHISHGTNAKLLLPSSTGHSEEEAIKNLRRTYDLRGANRYDKDAWRRDEAAMDRYGDRD